MVTPWFDHLLTAEMDLGVQAVRQAGKLCRAVQAEIDPGALQKKDRSPVTVADFGSQALICRALAAAFPADPVIGEEDAAPLLEAGNAAVLQRVVRHVQSQWPQAGQQEVCGWIDHGGAKAYAPRFWTLDPIDGTKGFLRGEQYAIALALVIEGELAATVLGCPNLGPVLGGDPQAGSLLAAIRGAGTWQLPLLGEGPARRLRVSDTRDPVRIRFCESVEADHSSHDDAARLAAALAIAAEPARLDSQAKYAVVARGEAEAYLRLPQNAEYREKIWDHAGGALVVTEAGGRVTDVLGRDLDFRRGHTLQQNLGVIVTNGHVHEAVLKAVAKLGIGRF